MAFSAVATAVCFAAGAFPVSGYNWCYTRVSCGIPTT